MRRFLIVLVIWVNTISPFNWVVGDASPRCLGNASYGLEPSVNRSLAEVTKSKLRKGDRERLARAVAEGRPSVTLLIASSPNRNEAVVAEITNAGGVIRYRDDEVSYLRARVPVQRVEEIAREPEAEAVNISGGIAYYASEAEQERPDNRVDGRDRERIPPPDRDTPPENPYIPSRDVGSPQFIAAHPSFDGRGVTVAVIENPGDVLCPELRTALTRGGKPAPKVIDVLSSYDPEDDSEYPGWVGMSDEVYARAGGFTYKGAAYRAPADGRYRIGICNLPSSHDFSFPGSSGPLAVLWDRETNTVWVDTNRDKSFADEKALMDYGVRNDIGIIGKDDPSTPLRESFGICVQTYPGRNVIRINVMTGWHGTAVASVAAGNGFFGGRANGVAPAAQIVFIHGGPEASHGGIESFILAARHPKVDVISASMGIFTQVNDGGSTLGVICDRLVDKYGKAILVAADNGGPGLNTVNEYSCGSRTVCVGGYVRADTWHAVYGAKADKDDYVIDLSDRGPRQDGGFKPDIVAPAAWVCAVPGMEPGKPATDAYGLPPGYRSGAGTSFATPAAAGVAALLISAAKQTAVRCDAERLGWAMRSSARFLSGVGAHEQGNGLLNVGAAWEALKAAPSPIAVGSVAPVRTVLSQCLNRPSQGPGIYEREGWVAGQTGQRIITLTRFSGPERPIEYALRWVGNDGTFSSSANIVLPLNTPVPLTVTISPGSSGAHSAILDLDGPADTRAVYQVMNTVVAAEQFTPENDFSFKTAGQARWLEYASYFFNVPPMAHALKVETKIQHGSLQLKYQTPTGKQDVERIRRMDNAYDGYHDSGFLTKTYDDPEPGVWEAIVVNQDTHGGGARDRRPIASFEFSAQVFGVDATQASFSQSGEGLGREIHLVCSNRFGAFVGGVADMPLGSMLTARPLFRSGGPVQLYEIDVPPGAERVTASIHGASDAAADLDLYLYFCRETECELKDFSNREGSEKSVTAGGPAPGKWKVMIDPVSVPARETTVEFEDVFTHPAFGSADRVEAPAAHQSGDVWTEKVKVNVLAVPTGFRKLASMIEITSGTLSSLQMEKNPASSGRGTAGTHNSLGNLLLKVDTVKEDEKHGGSRH